jgi:hypothetical protein
MGMWTTDNQDMMEIVLKAFNDAAYQRYNNHSYSAGYLESMIVDMLPHLPKRYQKALIQRMVEVTQRLEREAIEKMKENGFFVEQVQRPCD